MPTQPHHRSRSGAAGRGESGQAIVEFAFVLPLVLFVLFAIVDLSKAFNYWNDTQQLANVGARYAAVGDKPTGGALADSIKQMADSTELQSGSTTSEGVQNGGVVVCIQARDANGDGQVGVGDAITAEVTANYKWLNILSGAMPTPATNMRGRATMRIERMPPSGTSLTTSCTTSGL